MKLEHTIDRGVFLAPKVYGLIDINGNEVIKVKGVTQEIASDLHFNDLEQLLIEDSSKNLLKKNGLNLLLMVKSISLILLILYKLLLTKENLILLMELLIILHLITMMI